MTGTRPSRRGSCRMIRATTDSVTSTVTCPSATSAHRRRPSAPEQYDLEVDRTEPVRQAQLGGARRILDHGEVAYEARLDAEDRVGVEVGAVGGEHVRGHRGVPGGAHEEVD